MKILLLHDRNALVGRPDERDAIVQVEEIGAHLRAEGHSTATLGVGLDLGAASSALREQAPDLVFNLVESVEGHGRLIHLVPALLDALHMPYTGVRTEAMLLSSDKVRTKQLLADAGLPTPAWVGLDGASQDPGWPGQWIVKSTWEDASLGLDDAAVVEVAGVEELRDEIRMRLDGLGGDAFAEAWIEGREFNVAVLDTGDGHPDVLPIAEMCFENYPEGKPRMVGYRAKWDEGSFEYRHTVRRFDLQDEDSALIEELSTLSARCWRLLGLRGYARVDFRVDREGRPWILEVNPNPCLSRDAGFAAAAERAGLGAHGVIARIVDAAGWRRATGEGEL